MKYKTYSTLFVLISITLILTETNGQQIDPEDEDEQQMEEEESFMNTTSTKGIFDVFKRHVCPDLPNI